jgi:hypothetical protein
VSQADISSIGATAIHEYGIDVSVPHWDMTKISLYGLRDHPEACGG